MAEPERKYDDQAALEAIADLLVANPQMTFDEAALRVMRERPDLIDRDGYTLQ